MEGVWETKDEWRRSPSAKCSASSAWKFLPMLLKAQMQPWGSHSKSSFGWTALLLYQYPEAEWLLCFPSGAEEPKAIRMHKPELLCPHSLASCSLPRPHLFTTSVLAIKKKYQLPHWILNKHWILSKEICMPLSFPVWNTDTEVQASRLRNYYTIINSSNSIEIIGRDLQDHLVPTICLPHLLLLLRSAFYVLPHETRHSAEEKLSISRLLTPKMGTSTVI